MCAFVDVSVCGLGGGAVIFISWIIVLLKHLWDCDFRVI